ncbi:MAG: M50 family metallopeptidase [Polyangiales bacterium]
MQIVADWSLLLIFALVAVNLAFGVLPSWHPDWSPAMTWGVSLGAAVLFFASILVHELSHAVVARLFDMRVRGITLFVFGGVAQIEGEPPSPKAEFMIAAVGPLTSIVLGIGATLAGIALGGDALLAGEADALTALSQLGPVSTLLLWLGPINIMLGVFNLVPGFPLDGGRVLRSIIWGISGSLRRATRYSAVVGQGFAWLLITIGVLMALGVKVPLLGVGVVQGLWLVLIGWFLNTAAKMSYRQLLVRQALHGVPVWHVMHTGVTVLRPLTRLVDAYDLIVGSDDEAYPVVTEDGRFVGLLRFDDLPSRDEAGERTAGDLMVPSEQLQTLSSGDTADRALELLSQDDPVVVLDGGELSGMLRGRDVSRWLALHGRTRAA